MLAVPTSTATKAVPPCAMNAVAVREVVSSVALRQQSARSA
jgi:hypothetical protein